MYVQDSLFGEKSFHRQRFSARTFFIPFPIACTKPRGPPWPGKRFFHVQSSLLALHPLRVPMQARCETSLTVGLIQTASRSPDYIRDPPIAFTFIFLGESPAILSYCVRVLFSSLFVSGFILLLHQPRLLLFHPVELNLYPMKEDVRDRVNGPRLGKTWSIYRGSDRIDGAGGDAARESFDRERFHAGQ